MCVGHVLSAKWSRCCKHIQRDVSLMHPFIIEYWGKLSHERTKYIKQKPKTCWGWVGNIELQSQISLVLAIHMYKYRYKSTFTVTQSQTPNREQLIKLPGFIYIRHLGCKHIQREVSSTHPFFIEYWGKPSQYLIRMAKKAKRSKRNDSALIL